MEQNSNLIPDAQDGEESAAIENDTCAFSMHAGSIRRTIGKTTYVADLHFKEQGQTFAQKLKRVLKADVGLSIP